MSLSFCLAFLPVYILIFCNVYILIFFIFCAAEHQLPGTSFQAPGAGQQPPGSSHCALTAGHQPPLTSPMEHILRTSVSTLQFIFVVCKILFANCGLVWWRTYISRWWSLNLTPAFLSVYIIILFIFWRWTT